MNLIVLNRRQPIGFAQFVDKTYNFLSAIASIDSRFSCLAETKWLSDSKYSAEIVPNSVAGLSKSVKSLFEPISDEVAAAEYQRLAAGNKIASDSQRYEGWSTPSLYAYDAETESVVEQKDGGVTVNIAAGRSSCANAAGSSIVLDLPTVQDDPLVSFESVNALFLKAIKFYDNPMRGLVYSAEFRAAYREEKWTADEERQGALVLKSNFEGHLNVGWLTYIDFPPLPHLLPADIDFEVLPGGGTLIYTTRERCSAENPVHIHQAQHIHSVLKDLHLQQSQYALDGWPPDQAESDYEQQITGAPEGLKYLVKFCYFDGYDASRDVLLFAKLFRVMGVPENPMPNNLYCKAYLAEARRQLAAVEAGKATTPIEWHIGIEKHANALNKLFSRYQDIPGDRLKVVYSPYNGEGDI